MKWYPEQTPDRHGTPGGGTQGRQDTAFAAAPGSCTLSASGRGNHGLNFVMDAKKVMIEKQSINGREVWFRIDPHPIQRENPNIIPKEYFSATCFTQDPQGGIAEGEVIKDEDGSAKMFESPVAALSYARKKVEEK